MTHVTARPPLTISTPVHVWAVLFLRDLWGLNTADTIPPCFPTPSFRGERRSPNDAELLVVEDVWSSGVGGVAFMESVEGIFAAIKEAGELESWREWSHATKRAVQGLASPLSSSPSWQVRGEIAEHRPQLQEIVVLPVGADYAAMHGQALAVALTVYSDVKRLRDAIRSAR